MDIEKLKTDSSLWPDGAEFYVIAKITKNYGWFCKCDSGNNFLMSNDNDFWKYDPWSKDIYLEHNYLIINCPKRTRSGGGIIMKTVLVTFGLIVLFTICTAGGCVPDYSEGERVGVITKFSKKGLLFKSWEGSLNQGGTMQVSNEKGGSSVVPSVVDFNVQDPKIIESIKLAANEGKRVKITYIQWYIKPVSIDNERVITKVEFLDQYEQ